MKNPIPKTPTEITAELEALEECKKYAPHHSIFGDDNHAKIELQIRLLQGDIDPDNDQEWDEFSDDEQSMILEAKYWMDGEENESPSSGWDNFKPKK